jgi:deazaflavin-dependent oxidoreductase (nitroreductase family)
VSVEAEPDVCYLTTTGRRSGRPHEIEIWFAMSGGTAYILSGGRERSDWVRNLTASPEVTLTIGGRTRVGRARVVEAGTEEEAIARRLLLEKYGPRYAGDLTEWGRTALAVAIDRPG